MWNKTQCPPSCLLVSIVPGGVKQCGHEKRTACETQLWKSLVDLNKRFNFRKVTDMGCGAGGRLAGDETGKVGWRQIAKAPINQAQEAGLQLAGNEGFIEGLSRKVAQSALYS